MNRESDRERTCRWDWGTLTGVRPIKRALERLEAGLSDDEAASDLVKRCGVAPETAARMVAIARVERRWLGDPGCGCLYVSIPFCPSRCLYCSFPAESLARKARLLPAYLERLKDEISLSVNAARGRGVRIDCIYVGGGTPSVLEPEQIDDLLSHIGGLVDRQTVREYSFEAGRVDTITPAKLEAMRRHGVDRVSINPQTLSAEVQRRIGRVCDFDALSACFDAARRAGFRTVNSDLIVGLPGESVQSFADTVERLVTLKPENITVHALALKRGSRLNEQLVRAHGARRPGRRGSAAKLDWLPEQGEESMYLLAEQILEASEYMPYYLYRQKNIKGNLPNVGYTFAGHECVYNIRIVEERHDIFACGVGAVSKIAGPGGLIRGRVANSSSLEEYLGRFEEKMSRKLALWSESSDARDPGGSGESL